MSLKIGVIGAGQIVEDAHLPVLANISGVEISWLFDIDWKRLRLISKMYQIPLVTGNQVFDAIADIDVCLIAAPVTVRKEYIDCCAKHNVAVYGEKPFARNKEEHQYYSSLFPNYAISIGFQRRYYKSTNVIKQIIDTDAYGKLNRVEFLYAQYDLKIGGASKFAAGLPLPYQHLLDSMARYSELVETAEVFKGYPGINDNADLFKQGSRESFFAPDGHYSGLGNSIVASAIFNHLVANNETVKGN